MCRFIACARWTGDSSVSSPIGLLFCSFASLPVSSACSLVGLCIDLPFALPIRSHVFYSLYLLFALLFLFSFIVLLCLMVCLLILWFGEQVISHEPSPYHIQILNHSFSPPSPPSWSLERAAVQSSLILTARLSPKTCLLRANPAPPPSNPSHSNSPLADSYLNPTPATHGHPLLPSNINPPYTAAASISSLAIAILSTPPQPVSST